MATSKPNLGALKTWGRHARQRALERAGSGRISASAWLPELEAAQERGWRISWIAEGLGMSERRVSEILRAGRERRLALLEAPVFIEPPAAAKACLDFTVDGFKRFYERYSGRTLPRHCEDWVGLFIDHRNLMINVPPRHIKSTIFSVWIPLWCLAIDRNEQFLVVSKTRQIAVKFCRELEYHLSFNQQLIEDVGRFAPTTIGLVPWRPGMGELLVEGRTRETRSGDLSVQSRGMEQQILGMEATVVIVDDPTDSKTAQSPAAHREEMRKLREEILSRIEPAGVTNASGRAVVVGQRVAPGDLFEELAEQSYERGPHRGEPLWHVHKQPAVLKWPTLEDGSDAVTLWPEKFDWEEIMLAYERVGGEIPFATMYQQDPAPPGSSRVRLEWLEACRDPDRPLGVGRRHRLDDDPEAGDIARVVSIDPSPTEWNAMVVADVAGGDSDFGWEAWILDVQTWRGQTVEFKQHVEAAIRAYAPDYLIIEESSFWRWVTQDPWFERLSDRVRLIQHHTGANKNDAVLGADSLVGDFEFGRIHLPYGDDRARAVTQAYEKEVLAWPNGRVYDRFMATWLIKWNRKKLRRRVSVSGHFQGVLRPRLNASGRRIKQAREARLVSSLGYEARSRAARREPGLVAAGVL